MSIFPGYPKVSGSFNKMIEFIIQIIPYITIGLIFNDPAKKFITGAIAQPKYKRYFTKFPYKICETVS